MRNRPVVIVFVRAPQIGAVKRRLATGIGQAAAHRFYIGTTRRLLRRLGDDPRWDLHLAVTPDRATRQGRYWPWRYRRFAQGGGELGERMARAMQRFPHRPVVLVGSDIPDLSPRHVAAAFAALGRSELVFGPATDGGYWLVGARRGSMVRGLFRDVRWSGPDALADTLANAKARRAALLEALDDVDDAADYERLAVRGREKQS